MATTYTSSYAASTVQPRANIGETIAYGEYALTAALVVNDVIKMVKVPAGARVIDLIFSTPDLDSDSTPAIVIEIGDSEDTDRYIAASTVGQAGGVARLSAAAGLGYRYTADATIDVKIATAPDTSATEGTLRLAVVYTMA